MFYDKNSNIHEVLANKFNRKKTLLNDINNYNKVFEIQTQNNNDIKIELHKNDNINDFNNDIQTVLTEKEFKMNSVKPSASVDFNMTNNDDNKKIIKILPKEIIIPVPLEKDSKLEVRQFKQTTTSA